MSCFSAFRFRTPLVSVLSAAAILIACAKPASDDKQQAQAARYLYVSAGLCQAGANTTFTTATSSNIVYRVNLANGSRDITLVDYNGIAGESPVAVVDFDASHVLIAVEKTGARRIEKVEKRHHGARSNFSSDATALANTLTDMTRRADGSLFVSRVNGVALISATGVTQVASFVTANGGAADCGTTNAKYSSVRASGQGHLIYLNAENNDNKLGIVKQGPTCLAGTTPTPAAAFSTALARVPEANQIIAAFAGNTGAADMNTLQVYELTEDATTASLGAPTKIYDVSLYPATYPFQLYAISAMTYDPVGGHLYVATANQIAANIATAGNYQIEKFAYDPVGKKLTRIGSVPFYQSGIDTKCISSMFVGY